MANGQIRGDGGNDDGVVGTTNATDKSGVFGFTQQGTGVRAVTQSSANFGVFGSNDSSNPPTGGGAAGAGVFGLTNCPGGAGVFGANNGTEGVGVQGSGSTGVLAQSNTGSGVVATSRDGQGVSAFSTNDIAIFAKGAKFAGVFDGNVDVSKTLTVAVDVVLRNGDCAEEFDASIAAIDPGAVVVLADDGTVRPSNSPYDKRVAGVVSGAGDYKPALILDRHDSDNKRVPVSFLGKVYCKVDAEYGSIRVGDLLTTSPTLGHAMKVSEPLNAFGAVIGKALRSLERGQGLIPMLVALQ